MRCSRCGSDVPDNSRFCPSCGFDQAATTPVRAIATGEITEFDLVREALGGEYEVLEELGRGGMALVYRARELQLAREVAVKVLPFTFSFDADVVERFQREARTSAQLEHPNIISIYRVGQAGRVIYFVMRYLRGGSLAAILAERRRLAPAEIRRVLVEAGSALGYAAQRGVVHRDIKPDNIMFDEFGQSVLTDFGIAKAASGQRLTGTGMSIGTPHYMSPEQARAQDTDGRSDIYSLGIVAYQSLVGHVPYDGDDSFSIGYKHITAELPVPTLGSADERRLFEVIRRMLAKDPADRIQNCEQLVSMLQADNVAPVGSLRLRGAPPPPVLPTSPSPARAAPTLPTTPPAAPSASSAAVTGDAPPPTPPTPAPRPAPHPAPARRVAHRSAVMQQPERALWPWVLGVMLLALGVAGYLYLSAARRVPAGVAVDSTPAAADSAPPAGATPSATDTSGTQPRPSATAGNAPRGSVPAGGVPAPAARDSGALRLRGMPAGSTVQIDQRTPSGAITVLPAGQHEIAISAPLHQFFVDTVTVTTGDTLEVTPELVRIGARAAPGDRRGRARDTTAAAAGPCDPGPAYDAAQCFDRRPQPTEAPFVPVPEGTAQPDRGTQLWVRVSAAGETSSTRMLRSSGSRRFDAAAVAFVRRLVWEPASKDGQAVTAWIQLEVRPSP